MNDQDTLLLPAAIARGVRTGQVILHHHILLPVLEILEAVTDLLVVVVPEADHGLVEVAPDQATPVGLPLPEAKDNKAFLPSLSYSCRPSSCGLQPPKRSTQEN